MAGDYNATMVASMTAFGRAGGDLLDWEIRSVNHRYLELGFRLPDSLKSLEQPLRERTVGRIRRGKVDATLRLAGVAAPMPRLNTVALRKVLAAVGEVREHTPAAQINPLDLLRWPGVLEDDQQDLAELREAALSAYVLAVDDLIAHRASEGERIDELLRARLDEIERGAAQVRCLAESQGARLRQRLHKRITELVAAVEPERLAQEAALLVQKADVAEELDRLAMHVAQARASLAGRQPCGRRLDFLMQELSREANTLAAKGVLPEIGRIAVDLKVAIEQMREQVQNVE